MVAPTISELRIHPIKGLCPVTVDEITFLGHGRGIQHDREWALLNSKGQYVNGKSNPAVHRVRLVRFIAPSTVTLRRQALRHDDDDDDDGHNAELVKEETFDLILQHEAAEAWLCEALKTPGGRLVHSSNRSMVDDQRYDGATIVSQATINTVAHWYNNNNDDDAKTAGSLLFMDRFRPNIIVSGVPAFWKDTLCHVHKTHGKSLRVNRCNDDDDSKMRLIAADPVHRCVVPTRAPSTTATQTTTTAATTTTTENIVKPGTPVRGFYKTFMEHRRKNFVKSAPVERLTSGSAPLEAAFLCTYLAVLHPGMLRKGHQLLVSDEYLDLQKEVRRVRPMTSKSLQLVLDGSYAMHGLDLGMYRLITAANTVLPTALSNAIVAHKLPACMPKATATELMMGMFQVVGVAIAVVGAVVVMR